MKALLQRVSRAKVLVSEEVVGQIDSGLLVFLGVEPNDDAATADWLVDRVLGLRIFPADDKSATSKMDANVIDVGGSILVVSQFTLAADTSRGRRPSFTSAASPDLAEALYDHFVATASQRIGVATGAFGADMQVELVNDGPVTFMLERHGSP